MTEASSERASREPFGALADGTPVERLRLRGRGGFEAAILTYGAAVQALHAPDRDGCSDDVVLGHDDLSGYLAQRNFFGATVGRYANRIAGAAFTLDGKRHALDRNDGENSLHGGTIGLDRRVWTVEAIGTEPEPFATLALTSPDGEGGYPGTLALRLTYRVIDGTALSIAIEARTDRPTVVNVTHHGFWNLRGAKRPGDVLGHVLEVAAADFLPVDEALIPEGSPEAVLGTPFDFRLPAMIGARIREPHAQLLRARGYDHTYCLDGGGTAAPRPVARLSDRSSGRVLTLETDQPGLQVYSGNFLDATVVGKGGRPYRQSDAVCLEPQLWPDAPNRPDFPSARLDPGDTYRHHTILRFGIEGATP